MTHPSDSRELSSASELEEASKVPSVHGDGSISLTDDEGWPTCSSRSRCRRPKWTREEEMVLVEAHCTLGNAWVAIAECLPGRTPSEVKNIWHSTLRARKLETRSMLRAYVTALKDRADKPAARQQAMRAAQNFLSEATGGNVSSPGKRAHKRPAAQQQQQQQQQQRRPSQARTRDTTVPPSPPPSKPAATSASAAGSGADPMQVELEGAGVAGTPIRGPGAGARHDKASLTSAPAATPTAEASPTAGTGVAAAAAAAVAPTSGHRSSLGSEWSTVSSGAQEPWHPSAGGHSATNTNANTAAAHPLSGPGSADFMTATATPPRVMSFSPLMSPANSNYALPPPAPSPVATAAAAASGPRASTGTLVPMSATGGRFGSPAVPQSDSSTAINFQTTLPHSLAIGSGGCGGTAAAVSTATCGGGSGGGAAAGGSGGASAGWLVPYGTSNLADTTNSLVMRHHPAAALRGFDQGQGPACPSAAQVSWEPRNFTPAASAAAAHMGFATSAGGSGSDARSLWADVGGRALMSPTGTHPGAQAVPMAPATSSAAAAAAAASSGCALASKQLFVAPSVQTTASNGPQFRAVVRNTFSGLGNGTATDAVSGSSDSGGIGVVTLGLYGIMDEELLACIGA